jgi:4-hydroxyphenylpyruvate 3-dimethylallyltransferase
VFLGASLPLNDVLAAPDVPESLRNLAPALLDHGLDHVRYTAVDYQHRSVNLYFRVREPFSARQLTAITSLTGMPERSVERAQQLAAFLPPRDHVMGLTFGLEHGTVERVAFYASQLPDDALPTLGPRLTRFFTSIPSHDPHPVNVVAWSFGLRGAYVKAERSWFGDVAGLFRFAGVVVGGAAGSASAESE